MQPRELLLQAKMRRLRLRGLLLQPVPRGLVVAPLYANIARELEHLQGGGRRGFAFVRTYKISRI